MSGQNAGIWHSSPPRWRWTCGTCGDEYDYPSFREIEKAIQTHGVRHGLILERDADKDGKS